MKFKKTAASLIMVSVLLISLAGCAGPAGTSIAGANVNGSGHLVLTLSNNQTVDAGSVIGPTGAAGATGTAGAAGATGAQGTQGPAGLTGPTGAPGPAGPIGATGPQGPAGLAGTGGGAAAALTSVSVSPLIANVVPTLVYVDSTSRLGEDVGTGVIISATRGYILTAYHVTAGATIIEITLSNGQTIPATFVAGAKGRDYAILKLNTVPSGLQAATLGSSAAAAVGDYVISAGFALGYTPNPTVTFGMITAFRLLSDNFNYVQTDAAINSGDSGGPLVNMAGQVIGINDSADVTDNNGDPVMNMAYCLPMSELSPLIQQYVGG